MSKRSSIGSRLQKLLFGRPRRLVIAVVGLTIFGAIATLLLSNRPPYTPDHCFKLAPNGEVIISYVTEQSDCTGAVWVPPMINGVEIVTIGPAAFQNRQLNELILPDSVRTIHSNAFANNQLYSVILPAKLDTIGAMAFANNQLTDIYLPDSVRSLGHGSFQNNQLTTVHLSEHLTAIPGLAFANNRLGRLELPADVMHIAKEAFRNNQLVDLSVPNSVRSISAYAFFENPLKLVDFHGARDRFDRDVLGLPQACVVK